MIHRRIVFIVFGWLLAGFCFAADTLVEREAYVLTQLDVHNMLAAGEHIAVQAFTPEEKQQLQAWAVELFRHTKNIKGVVNAFDKYASYLKQANSFSDPDMQRMVWHHLYREMVFRWQFPRYRKQQQTLLDVIQKYNPVKIRLDEEKMLLAAKDPVLAEQGGYFISQPMVTALQTVAEFLARQPVSVKHRKGLAEWAVADFNNAPQQASSAYAYFFDQSVPQALAPFNLKQQESFRAKAYQDYYFLFKADKVAQQWSTDLMDVVTHYNPPLIVDETNQLLISESELDGGVATARYFSDQLQLNMDLSDEQQVMAGILIRQLQINQQIFDRTMQTYREHSDNMGRSIRDLSTIQSLQITGNKVLEKHKDYFLIEDQQGRRYSINR